MAVEVSLVRQLWMVLRCAVAAVLVAGVASCGGTEAWPARGTTPSTEPQSVHPGLVDRRSLATEIAACSTVLARLAHGADPVPGRDLFRHAENGDLPPLPLTGFENVLPDGLAQYPNRQTFLTYVPVFDLALHEQLLRRDGFAGAAAMGFQLGSVRYGAKALKFASKAAAEDFNKQTLRALCRGGKMSTIRAVPDAADTVAYIRSDGLTPFSSNIVIGNVVLQLDICSCVHGVDTVGLAGSWAVAIDKQYGLPNGPARQSALLAALLPTTSPDGYSEQPDSNGYGPATAARAATQDRSADATTVLSAAGFVSAFSRAWTGPTGLGDVIWLYQFRSAQGAALYARHRASAFLRTLNNLPATQLSAMYPANALGVTATNGTDEYAAVLFAKDIYVVTISVAGRAPEVPSAIARAIATQIEGNIKP